MGKKPREESILAPADTRVSHLIFDNAFQDIGQMNDDVSGETFQPVMFSPVYLDEDMTLLSQDIHYSESVITRNTAAEKHIGMVAAATSVYFHPTNPIAGLVYVAENLDDPELNAMCQDAISQLDTPNGAINSTYIGGLFAIKRYPDSVVALRVNYSKKLMKSAAAERLAQTEITDRLRAHSKDRSQVIGDDVRLRDASALLVLLARKNAAKLKPAIVSASRIGIQGF